MEGDEEDFTVQSSKDRGIELISREDSRKRKGVQKKKLVDTQYESNIITVAEELSLIRKYSKLTKASWWLGWVAIAS